MADGMGDMDDMGDMDGMGPPTTVPTDPQPTECATAIGDSTVELSLIIGGTPILILRSPDDTIAALDGTTCAEIPVDDGTEMVADPAPDGCRGAIGDSTVELSLIIGGTPILILRSPDDTIAALDGTTCAEIPSG